MDNKQSLALQLYSARHIGIDESLEIIADAGYTSVEAYQGNTDAAVLSAFQAALAKNGLTVASMHIALDELRNNLNGSLALSRSLGCEHIVCPYLTPESRPDSKDNWISLAKDLDDINAQIEGEGMRFAWHNHDFEFDTLEGDVTPMQLLLEHAPKMHWEIDLGWITRAGNDPVSWLSQYQERVSAIHLKDLVGKGENTDEDDWADVGFGIQAWADLQAGINACDNPLLITEHDNPSDFERFATRSFNTVKSW